MRLERAILIVLDGCGVGAAPDAADYGDTGENTPNTLGHLAEAVETSLRLAKGLVTILIVSLPDHAVVQGSAE